MKETAKQHLPHRHANQKHAFEAALLRTAALFFFAVTVACGPDALAQSKEHDDANENPDVAEEGVVPDGVSVDDAALQDDGYIYVAKENGEPPLGDTFNLPGDVYLFGYIPKGEYQFQITDKACTELLAGPDAPGNVPDTSGRIVSVKDGWLDGKGLAPFLTATADHSGAYQVMLVPVGEWELPSEGCYGADPEIAYTANFSLVPGPLTDSSYCATGGVFEGEEPGRGGIEGVRVAVYSSSREQAVTETYSERDGLFSVCGLRPGESYQLKQDMPAGYTQVSPETEFVEFTNIGRDDLYVPPFRLVAAQ